MDGLQVNQVLDVFGRIHGPADVATDPVEGQGLVPTELTSKLREKRAESAQQRCRHMMVLEPEQADCSTSS